MGMKKKREGKQSPFYPNSLGFSRQSMASVAREETGNACCVMAVSYTHLTLPTNTVTCRSRWSPYH